MQDQVADWLSIVVLSLFIGAALYGAFTINVLMGN
jgi:hypothetical protein